MKRAFAFALALLLVAAPAVAQMTFEEWRASQQVAFADWSEEQQREYRDFVRADSLAYAAFREQVEQVWDEFAISTKTDWVEYGDGLASRTSVDFEEGEVSVEVLVPEEEAQADPELIGNRLREAIAVLVSERGTSRDYDFEGAGAEPRLLKPNHEGQPPDWCGGVGWGCCGCGGGPSRHWWVGGWARFGVGGSLWG